MTKREAIVTAVTLLAAQFNRETSAPLFESYWLVLSDLSPEEIATATRRALSEGRFMPTAAELLKFSGHARSAVFDCACAWEAVRRAVDQHDYTTSVDFGPLVNAIVRNMGGWLRLCDLGRDALDVWARKDFERLFAEFSEKDPGTLHGEPHAGQFGGAPVRIAIGGKMPPLQITAPTNQAIELVRQLADAKSQSRAASESGNPVPTPPPAREVKPKASAMTPEEVDARKAQIAAQLAARGVTT